MFSLFYSFGRAELRELSMQEGVRRLSKLIYFCEKNNGASCASRAAVSSQPVIFRVTERAQQLHELCGLTTHIFLVNVFFTDVWIIYKSYGPVGDVFRVSGNAKFIAQARQGVI